MPAFADTRPLFSRRQVLAAASTATAAGLLSACTSIPREEPKDKQPRPDPATAFYRDELVPSIASGAAGGGGKAQSSGPAAQQSAWPQAPASAHGSVGVWE